MPKHSQSNSAFAASSFNNEVPVNMSASKATNIGVGQIVDYKFRAECTLDAQAVRAVLIPWLLEWTETRNNFIHEGSVHLVPDVVVEFRILDEGPSYGEILWLIDGIGNCHVAAETLSTVENYSGERISRRAFHSPATHPNKELLNRALAAVKTRQQTLSLELERALRLYRTYETAGRLGDKWQPFSPDEPSPGWIIPVEHETSGLISVRCVSAPIGCKKWQKRGNEIINARLSTINA